MRQVLWIVLGAWECHADTSALVDPSRLDRKRGRLAHDHAEKYNMDGRVCMVVVGLVKRMAHLIVDLPISPLATSAYRTK